MKESFIYKDLQTAGIVAVLAFGISKVDPCVKTIINRV